MEITRKTWGLKFNIFKNDLNEVSFLELDPNSRCSWHTHKTKYNLFFVVEGLVGIKTEFDMDGAKTGTGITKLGPHEFFTTSPGERHEFQTYDVPARLIEIMYVRYDENDIERENIGGLRDESTRHIKDA